MRGLVIGAAVLAMVGQAHAETVKARSLSLNGGFVYEEVPRWSTSDDIVQISRSTGQRREVIDGNSLAVLRNGPWRGFLLVQRHRYRSTGGSYDPTDVVRPDGKVIAEVPGTAADDNPEIVASWLSSHGWIAN